jgi:predicted nucleic acid-binding protein
MAYFLDEPGVVDLEEIRQRIRIPFMALCEFHFMVTKKRGKAAADQCFGLVKSWEADIIHSSEEGVLAASRLKDRYRLGIGDAFIAATSLCLRLPLLTYDQDYLPLAKEIHLLGIE